MEVLRFLNASSPLVHPPQEFPVDLTTGDKICHNTLRQQITYPHLRIHSNQCSRISTELSALKYEHKTLLDNDKISQDNHYTKRIKDESHHVLREQKRKGSEEHPESGYQSPKRLKPGDEQENNIKKVLKDNVKSVLNVTQLAETDAKQTSKNNVKDEKNLHHFGLDNLAGHKLPINVLEHTSLIENLKNSTVTGTSTSIKEIESLLAAVQQSQMLYYSYCTKLLQNLQARKLISSPNNLNRAYGSYSSRMIQPENEYEEGMGNNRSPTKETNLESPAFLPHIPQIRPECNRSTSSTGQVSRSSLSSPSSQVASSTEDESSPNQSTSKEGRKGSPSRRRAPRALTGKHVRPGTGASLSTLRTLRQKLEERRQTRNDPEERGNLARPLGSGRGVRDGYLLGQTGVPKAQGVLS